MKAGEAVAVTLLWLVRLPWIAVLLSFYGLFWLLGLPLWAVQRLRGGKPQPSIGKERNDENA